MEQPPKIQLATPPGLSGRADYSYAAVLGEVSTLVLTAGAAPLDADGSTVSTRGIRGQAEKVMDNLDTALQGAGLGLGDVVKATLYVVTSERDDLMAAWEVVSRRFGRHRPAITLLGVTVLRYVDQLVEVDAVAAR